MELKLERVEKQVGPSTHLYPMDLALQPRAVTVLLGATQAGKTTLMRLMAGLDTPSRGRVSVDGHDMTGVSVRERQVAMVYQQFINYPSMTVFDNIASPLKLRGGLDKAAIARRVRELAAKLHIEPFLERLPAELSGGQQQRVALARALAKNAPLMLLDEPLVNLDYKLREELREELSALFANGDSTVVYATTEPSEALLLGGYTAVMDQGELLQYGPTPQVFHRPKSIRVARAFSDPPMNLVSGQPASLGVQLSSGLALNVPLPNGLRGVANDLTIGLRASALRVQQRPGDVALPGSVELAEISGSDTFVHVDTAVGEVVAQLTGVHHFELGARITLFLHPSQVYVFGAQGELLVAPTREAGAEPLVTSGAH
jgi:glycerol transport system ATP-binding protein